MYLQDLTLKGACQSESMVLYTRSTEWICAHIHHKHMCYSYSRILSLSIETMLHTYHIHMCCAYSRMPSLSNGFEHTYIMYANFTRLFREHIDGCHPIAITKRLATHCNSHCNALQHTVTHTATHCISLQHNATYCNIHCNTHRNTHCSTQCNTHCNTLCNTLCKNQIVHKRLKKWLGVAMQKQNAASQCNTLQHTAMHTAKHSAIHTATHTATAKCRKAAVLLMKELQKKHYFNPKIDFSFLIWPK